MSIGYRLVQSLGGGGVWRQQRYEILAVIEDFDWIRDLSDNLDIL